MRKIKKDDTVQIISGKDRGKSGKVLHVDTAKDRIIVEGCNMIQKHTKPSAQNQNGGIVTKEGSIHISNAMLVVDGKPTRVGFEIRDGKKVRVAKKTGKAID
ncbi:MAG: 50S ribosomal protein L24 [Stomatobaculum sp.]